MLISDKSLHTCLGLDKKPLVESVPYLILQQLLCLSSEVSYQPLKRNTRFMNYAWHAVQWIAIGVHAH